MSDFQPDWASPPGDTINDIIQERKLTRTQVAGWLRINLYKLDRMIKGQIPITDMMAGRLGDTLGPNKSFWIKREEQYRKDLERLAGNNP